MLELFERSHSAVDTFAHECEPGAEQQACDQPDGKVAKWVRGVRATRGCGRSDLAQASRRVRKFGLRFCELCAQVRCGGDRTRVGTSGKLRELVLERRDATLDQVVLNGRPPLDEGQTEPACVTRRIRCTPCGGGDPDEVLVVRAADGDGAIQLLR